MEDVANSPNDVQLNRKVSPPDTSMHDPLDTIRTEDRDASPLDCSVECKHETVDIGKVFLNNQDVQKEAASQKEVCVINQASSSEKLKVHQESAQKEQLSAELQNWSSESENMKSDATSDARDTATNTAETITQNVESVVLPLPSAYTEGGIDGEASDKASQASSLEENVDAHDNHLVYMHQNSSSAGNKASGELIATTKRFQNERCEGNLNIHQSSDMDNMTDSHFSNITNESGLPSKSHHPRASSAESQMSLNIMSSKNNENEEKSPADDSQSNTGIGTVLSMQSLTNNQTNHEKDVVQISRAELTNQALAAQTMCIYMQTLVQKNKTLNEQNKALQDRIMQTRQLHHLEEKRCTQAFTLSEQAENRLSLEHENLQIDGEYKSASLQLPSQLCIDGDSSIKKTDDGVGLDPCTQHTSYEPSQKHFQQDPFFAGSTISSVSPEQYELMESELVKAKLLIEKIHQDGGLHPRVSQELVSLREKVKNLQKENMELKTEIQNQVLKIKNFPQGPLQEQIRMLQDELHEKNSELSRQRGREGQLLELITQLGKGKKQPSSQPSSSVGYPALPTIPVKTASAGCQTQFIVREDFSTQTMPMQVGYQLQQVKQEKKLMEEKHKEILQRMEISLKAMKAENDSLCQQNTHLMENQSKFDKEVYQLKKKLCQESNRNGELEAMIADERKRYHRDETEMLGKIKQLSREQNIYRRLVLEVDLARTEGKILPQDCKEQLAAIHKDSSSASSNTVRSASLRVGQSASPALSSFQPSTIPRTSDVASSQSNRSSPGGSRQGSGHLHGAGSGSAFRNQRYMNRAQRSDGVSTSLPQDLTSQQQQYPGHPGHGIHQPLRNMGPQDPSVLSQGSASSSRQRYQ